MNGTSPITSMAENLVHKFILAITVKLLKTIDENDETGAILIDLPKTFY